jgi:integrase
MGVAEARDAARALRPAVREADKDKRVDPVEQARRERGIGRDAKEGVGTLAALIELYGKKRGSSLKSWSDCKRRIDSVFGRQLKKPVATMKAADLQFEADNWDSGQSAAAAVRYIRPILKWASEGGRNYASRELANLTPPATVERRDRILSRDEISRLIPVLKASPRPYAACMRFLLLTLARREEAGRARWRDVNFATRIWTIGNTKNDQPHHVPLPKQAVDLLQSMKARDEDGVVIEPIPGALIFSTSTGKPLGNWDRESKTLQIASKTDGWTRHDLRRTGATMLGEMGEMPHVIESALNHVALHSRLAANYNQGRYREQVEAALQRLADALDGIAKDAAKVVQLHAGRAA